MSSMLREPIFIVGTGRSGSTMFFDIFSEHPNVAWLSTLARDYPHAPYLNSILMSWRSSNVLSAILRKPFGPAEAYKFWDVHCPGFSNPCRDLRADDVLPLSSARIREAFAQMLTPMRNRFLAKITGWPRIQYLQQVFPDARFLEMTRDPCATASSLLEVPFWDGWRGPPNWRRGQLPDDLRKIWEQEEHSFVALAAIEYAIFQRAMVACRATLPVDAIQTVAYSNLCRDPISEFRKILDFCHLPWLTSFERKIKRIRLVDRDDKWRRRLTSDQQTVLVRTLEAAQRDSEHHCS